MCSQEVGTKSHRHRVYGPFKVPSEEPVLYTWPSEQNYAAVSVKGPGACPSPYPFGSISFLLACWSVVPGLSAGSHTCSLSTMGQVVGRRKFSWGLPAGVPVLPPSRSSPNWVRKDCPGKLKSLLSPTTPTLQQGGQQVGLGSAPEGLGAGTERDFNSFLWRVVRHTCNPSTMGG